MSSVLEIRLPFLPVAVLCLVTLSAVILLWKDERGAVEGWRAELTNRSATASRQIGQEMTEVDVILSEVAKAAADQSEHLNGHLASASDRAGLGEVVSLGRTLLPRLSNLFIVSEKGVPVAPTSVNLPGSDIIARLLESHLTNWDSAFVAGTSPTEPGRSTQIYISKAILGRGGNILGLVVAAIPDAFFSSEFARICPDCAMTLFRSDGKLLATHSPGLSEMRSGSGLNPEPEVGFLLRAPVDVPQFPLTVLAAASDAVVLRAWRQQVVLTGWLTASLAILVVALNVRVARLVGSQVETNSRLRHQFALRLEAQASLQRLNDDLEERVQERTLEISQSVAALEKEVQERSLAEAKLRESNDLLDAVVRSSPIAIISMDRDALVTTWSTGAEAMFGFTAEEVVGRFDPSLPQDDDGEFEAILKSTFSARRGVEATRVRKDGTLINVRVAGAPLHSADGEDYGVLLNVEDLTAMQTAQMRIEQAQRMEAIGQLTGGIAHDFNNLLSVVIGNLELVRDEQRIDTESSKLVVIAIRASERAAELTHRLLAFARKQRLAPVTVRVGPLIGELRSLIDRTLGQDVEISVTVAPEIWPIFVDPSELENVILNLAINARDAMPCGGRLQIEATNQSVHFEECGDASNTATSRLAGELREGDYVRLTVSDTGSGIPPHHLNRVFEPFFTTKETGKGSGLGLAMAFGFAQQSGGTIRIYSVVDSGTSVQLYLPRGDLDGAFEPAKPTPVLDRGSETVLVVEDNPDVRQLSARMLRGLGYKVLTAGTGREALTLLESGAEADLLLADIVLPGGMNGPDLVKAVNALRPSMKRLLSSGYPFQALQQSGRASADVSFLAKPFHKHELAAAVRRVLDTERLPVGLELA